MQGTHPTKNGREREPEVNPGDQPSEIRPPGTGEEVEPVRPTPSAPPPEHPKSPEPGPPRAPQPDPPPEPGPRTKRTA